MPVMKVCVEPLCQENVPVYGSCDNTLLRGCIASLELARWFFGNLEARSDSSELLSVSLLLSSAILVWLFLGK